MTESQVRAEAARRKLRLDRRGAGWHLHGAGVDVLVGKLAHLHPADFVPVDFRKSIDRARTRLGET